MPEHFEPDPAAISPTVIVGTGLLGASIGMALTRAGVQVHLSDAVEAHARVAASLGAGLTEAAVPEQVRMVIVATPPRTLATVVAQSLETFPQAAVTDIGSVKGAQLRTLQEQGVDLSRYLGSHPMAGSQYSGPVTARADMFVERTWAVTPHRDVTQETAARIRQLIELSCARYLPLDPDDHDRAVAQVSHLPQLVSVLMADHLLGVPPRHMELAGQGLRDVTRIAGSDPELWEQIIVANAEAIRPELYEIQRGLAEMIAALEDPKRHIGALLQRGVNGTAQIPGKHGRPARSYARPIIEIPDTPGALAELFADISAAGINVEDVGITHDPVRRVGYLEVAVEPAREEDFTTSMREAGWTVDTW